MSQPQAFLRRSNAYRKTLEAGARFAEVAGGALAMEYANATDEGATAKKLGLADLSLLPHDGFKGAGASDWLASAGLKVPSEPNRAERQSDGGLALRLAANEIMILGNLKGEAPVLSQMKSAWAAGEQPPKTPRGWPLPRQETHAWFLITGEKAPEMFAKLCGVDLRADKFANGLIAQTSLAKMSGVICRDDRGGTLAYHLLFDSASAAYLWDCLIDAMAEFGGGPVGLKAMQGLG